MVSWIISRLVVLIFGTLYPAYSSYKAVKSKDVKEYVKWMMYWIIFALFTTAETITDIFLCWLPFYYELKIAFVVWLLSPYTKGSSVLYRKFVHPTLSSKEKDIDDYLCQAKDKSYDALVHFGRKGLNVAATAAVTAAAKVSHLCDVSIYRELTHWQGQGALSERLRSFSMQDLSVIQRDASPPSISPGVTRSTTGHPRARMTARSNSEAATSKRHLGGDFDLAEYELLSPEPCGTPEPCDTPQARFFACPTPPVTDQVPSPPQEQEDEDSSVGSAAVRLAKRRAPEPPPRVLRPRPRSKSTSSPDSDTM
ncbi:receptor expression-enhancing protein 1-like isoform X2 [Brienomyrus brachyistius]|uniref:receptor expression-enhancing protein 1-like isoform X2 n=1 Tax=Brienomyrus brachyistius TaxID=42636 RepID=UPI0020B2764E|nr:receptor expression-enhancing protein 1-like isoform X2 [Brienomyrus brachyistius]